MSTFRNADLEAYLDEALPTEEMTRIETALRADSQLAGQLAEIIARRDSGMVSLGAIWRRHRMSCPARQELGSYLLGVLPEEAARYLEFHLEVAGCRYCQANLSDLAKTSKPNRTRRPKIGGGSIFSPAREGCGKKGRVVSSAAKTHQSRPVGCVQHGFIQTVRCAKPSNATPPWKQLLTSVRNAPFLTASLHAPYIYRPSPGGGELSGRLN